MSTASRNDDHAHKGLLGSGLLVFVFKGAGAALLLGHAIVVTHLLDQKEAGVFFLVYAIAFICSVVGCLGVDKASLRYGATAATDPAGEKLRSLFRTASLIVGAASAAVTVVVMLLARILAEKVFRDPALTAPLRLMALSIVPTALAALFSQYLYALRRVVRATLTQATLLPFISLALLWFAATRYGLAGAVTAHVIAACATAALGGAWALGATPRQPSGEWFDARGLLTLGLPLFWIAFLNLIVNMTDTVMIGIWMDTADVAVYTAALRASKIGDLVLVSANSVVAPLFAIYWSQGKRKALVRLQRSSTFILVGIAVVFSSVLIVFARPILAIFGPDFVAGDSALIALALGQFVLLATGPAAFLLMMTGRERAHRNNVIVAAVLNVVLNLILIPPYGVLGAAIATTLSLTVKNVTAFILAWMHLAAMKR